MFWKIAAAFSLAAGVAIGFHARGIYDEWKEPSPLEIGDTFNALVTDVYDADTMTLDDTYKVRIWGIDAPERSQRCINKKEEIVTCGLQARDELRKLILGKDITCEIKGFDGNYNRLIAQCFLGKKDPIETLVEQGWAFSDAQYADDPYRKEQNIARTKKAGVWSMEVMVPKQWRACLAFNRGGAQPPKSCLKPLGPITPRPR